MRLLLHRYHFPRALMSLHPQGGHACEPIDSYPMRAEHMDQAGYECLALTAILKGGA